MNVFTAIIYTPDGEERFLNADGTLTPCEACATRFIDAVTAEAAAIRATKDGWAFLIEETEL